MWRSFTSSQPPGIADEDIEHGIENALVIEEVAEDPVRYLVLGPDQAGNLLELIVLDLRDQRSSTR